MPRNLGVALPGEGFRLLLARNVLIGWVKVMVVERMVAKFDEFGGFFGGFWLRDA